MGGGAVHRKAGRVLEKEPVLLNGLSRAIEHEKTRFSDGVKGLRVEGLQQLVVVRMLPACVPVQNVPSVQHIQTGIGEPTAGRVIVSGAGQGDAVREGNGAARDDAKPSVEAAHGDATVSIRADDAVGQQMAFRHGQQARIECRDRKAAHLCPGVGNEHVGLDEVTGDHSRAPHRHSHASMLASIVA